MLMTALLALLVTWPPQVDKRIHCLVVWMDPLMEGQS